jgi:hypothetical protein
MLNLSSYQPSSTPKRFIPTGREVERVKITHPFIEGFRHTLGFLVRYSTGAYYCRLQCVKGGCRRPDGSHEILIPISEDIARVILELYCEPINEAIMQNRRDSAA